MALSYAEGLALIERRCAAVEELERVAPGGALARILASDIEAPMDYPLADNSAVDGYAFRHHDLARGAPLRLVGTSAAGHPHAGRIAEGETVRIFTGALLPPGADTVAMQEDVKREDDGVLVPPQLRLSAHVRRAGEDIKAKDVVLQAGERLGPAQIGLLASLGIDAVTVRRRPRVAIMSIGDELLYPGEAPRLGSIYESNRAVLLALLSGLGIAASDHGIIPDTQEAVRQALAAAAADHDAVLTSAGASVGDEDHVRRALLSVGGIDFAGLSIKPGKPLVLGHVSGVPFFGLPGNPVAMMTGFLMLVRHGLLRLAGAAPVQYDRFWLRADFRLQRKPGLREFLRGTRHGKGTAEVVRLFPRRSAGSISAMAGSAGLIEIAEDIALIEPGMLVPFLPFALVGL